MRRTPRYPQSRTAPAVAVALVAAIVGIAIPATVTDLFQSRGQPWSEASSAPAAVASMALAPEASCPRWKALA